QPFLFVARVPVVARRGRPDLPDHLAHATTPKSPSHARGLAFACPIAIMHALDVPNGTKSFLEQDRRERSDLLETAALVHATGRQIVVVDIQADRWCDPAQRIADDGGDAGRGQ